MARNLAVILALLTVTAALPSQVPLSAAKPAHKLPAVDRFGDPLPKGALARLGTIRLRHCPYAASAAFSPDGKLLATLYYSLRLWDLGTGRLVREFIPEKEQIYREVTFAPHGRWLAVISGQQVLLLDPATGAIIVRLESKEKGELSRLFLSPDGKRLSAVSQEGTVIFVWDLLAEKQALRLPALRLRQHKSSPCWVRFPGDGKTIQAVCRSGLHHWDARTGKLLKVADPPALPGSLSGFYVSPDGCTLVLATRRHGKVHVLDAQTGKKLYKLTNKDEFALGAAFTPDGGMFALIWMKEGLDDPVAIRVHETATGKVVRQIPLPAADVGSLMFAPDGRTLMMLGALPAVCFWDTKTGKRRLEFPAHEGGVQALAFTPDGSKLVSGANDGTIRVWETATGKPLRLLPGHRYQVNQVAVLPDGQAVLSCGADYKLRLQDLETGRELRLKRDLPKAVPDVPNPNLVKAMRLSADGRTLTTFGQGFHLWDLSTGRLIARRAYEDSVSSTDLPPDPRTVLECLVHPLPDTDDPNIKWVPANPSTLIWRDLVTGRQLLSLSQPGRSSHCVAFSPDEVFLATVTDRPLVTPKENWKAESTIRLWELATGKERLHITIDPKEFTGWLQQMAFSPDGRMLATVREDRVIQIWDVGTGQESLRHTGYVEGILVLAFSPDARSLATGHEDGTILIWDISRARPSPTARQAAAKDLERWWTDLADRNARVAHRAIANLVAVPMRAVPLLCEHLKPVAPLPLDKLQRLIADLERAEFKRRDAADRALVEFGEQAFPALRQALGKVRNEEARRRLQKILDKTPVMSADALRTIRAIQVLEWIRTVEAQRVLSNLGQGDPAARVTQTAQRALQRLERR